MNGVLMRKCSRNRRYSPSAGAAFTPANTENIAKRRDLALNR
jgi:hypothetical protein